MAGDETAADVDGCLAFAAHNDGVHVAVARGVVERQAKRFLEIVESTSAQA